MFVTLRIVILHHYGVRTTSQQGINIPRVVFRKPRSNYSEKFVWVLLGDLSGSRHLGSALYRHLGSALYHTVTHFSALSLEHSAKSSYILKGLTR